jgi:hypothetical protein
VERGTASALWEACRTRDERELRGLWASLGEEEVEGWCKAWLMHESPESGAAVWRNAHAIIACALALVLGDEPWTGEAEAQLAPLLAADVRAFLAGRDRPRRRRA